MSCYAPLEFNCAGQACTTCRYNAANGAKPLPTVSMPANPKGAGKKYDADKPDMTLLMELRNSLKAVVRVMEFGAQKYERGSFLQVENAVQRYHAAANRHWLEPIGTVDDESKLLHLAHEACDSLFALEVYIREQEAKHAE